MPQPCCPTCGLALGEVHILDLASRCTCEPETTQTREPEGELLNKNLSSKEASYE